MIGQEQCFELMLCRQENNVPAGPHSGFWQLPLSSGGFWQLPPGSPWSNPLHLIQSMRGETEWIEAFSSHPIVSPASSISQLYRISIEKRGCCDTKIPEVDVACVCTNVCIHRPVGDPIINNPSIQQKLQWIDLFSLLTNFHFCLGKWLNQSESWTVRNGRILKRRVHFELSMAWWLLKSRARYFNSVQTRLHRQAKQLQGWLAAIWRQGLKIFSVKTGGGHPTQAVTGN